MKLDKLVRLEKALEGRLDRLTRRKGAPEEPFEWIPPMLDEIEQRVVPSGGRGRVFPYEVIRVELRVDPASLEAARAVFGAGAFEERVRERLRQVRCEAPAELSVRLRVRTRQADDESPYVIAFRHPVGEKRTDAEVERERAATAVPAVRIMVVEGQCRRRIHALKLERINLGRLESVEGRGAQRLRRNQVAFLDRDDPVNTTVSRAHAHIEYFAGDGFRVFDDGSAHGTRIMREGRSIAVARGAVRGVRLRNGDEIQLGMARLVFLAE
ncbi:MAG TPA: FHA domain-containing protein [Candidatus Eisenbacteria bacterium]|nr:FHA domain-containing protein [Candidatus Eisenbacteria bacterium]